MYLCYIMNSKFQSQDPEYDRINPKTACLTSSQSYPPVKFSGNPSTIFLILGHIVMQSNKKINGRENVICIRLVPVRLKIASVAYTAAVG